MAMKTMRERLSRRYGGAGSPSVPGVNLKKHRHERSERDIGVETAVTILP